MIDRPSAVCALLLFGVLCDPRRTANAQDTTRRPPVANESALPKPGPRTLAGAVQDTAGNAIDSVEVWVTDTQRRTFTDAGGRFRFENLKPGSYVVRARRPGYLPQERTLAVDADGGTATFQLLPAAQVLEPVISRAARGGLGGVIGDTAYHALVGAEVRVMGSHARVALTDSAGAFFLPLPQGSYMVSIIQPGFAPRALSVTIPPDSGRWMSVLLAPGSENTNTLIMGWDAMRQRLEQRSNVWSRFFTREDAKRLGMEWLPELVLMGAETITPSWYRKPPDHIEDCWATVNGALTPQQLWTINVDDIESVEIYQDARATGVQTPSTPGVHILPGRQPQNTPPITQPVSAPSHPDPTGVCPRVYVWTRG